MLVKCYTQHASNFGKLSSEWLQKWKRSVLIPIPKKDNEKECSNYCTIALISHTSKVMLKILQARLQHYMNHELPDIQARFRKVRATRVQIGQNPLDHQKSKSSRKTSISTLFIMPKLWLCGSQQTGKF